MTITVEDLERDPTLILRKVRRLGRWSMLFAAIAVTAAVYNWTQREAAAGGREPIVCLYDCADNGPCENDKYCLGPCVCDLDLEECVPE